MQIERHTTFNEFMTRTGWEPLGTATENIAAAYAFFLRTVPISELNKHAAGYVVHSHDSPHIRRISEPNKDAAGDEPEPDSGAWNPADVLPGKRTQLISWMQSIDFAYPVDVQRLIPGGFRLKQFRFPGDPPRHIGNWFTWDWSAPGKLALPSWQNVPRIFEVQSPILCLHTKAADNSTCWVCPSNQPSHYRRGGGDQLFIYGAANRLKLKQVTACQNRRSPLGAADRCDFRELLPADSRLV